MKKKNIIWVSLVVFAISMTIGACYAFTGSDSKNQEENAGTETPAPAPNDSTVINFDKTIAGNKLTVVDFYTTWCGPCKWMKPHVLRAASELKEQANVLQIDAEAYPEISGRYNLEGYPTLIFIKKGVVVHTQIGAIGFDSIKELIEKYK